MPYINATEGRYRSIDVASFARDLAAELGGIARPFNPDYPRENQAIDLTDKTTLNIRADDYKGRVNISISAADVPWNERPTYESGYATESATINPDGRPMAAIAKDVTKRVIQASADAIAKCREFASTRRNERADLAGMVAGLDGTGISARIADDGLHASIDVKGVHVAATMYPNGTVNVARLESMSLEKFRKIIEILKA